MESYIRGVAIGWFFAGAGVAFAVTEHGWGALICWTLALCVASWCSISKP